MVVQHRSSARPETSSEDSSSKQKNRDSEEHSGGNEGGENNQHGDEEKAEDNDDYGKAAPVGFWDPSLASVRKRVIIKWIQTLIILFAFILVILSLYWGALFGLDRKMSNLKIAVVSFDGQAPYTVAQPLVGQAVIQAANQQRAMGVTALGYEIQDPSEYNGNAMAVRQAVFDEKFYAAVIVNANASYLLRQAVEQGNQTYDPMGALQVVYEQARDETSYDSYITPQLNQFITNVQAQFGKQWASTVLADTTLDAATYSRAPQAINPAIGASMYNLRPFVPPQTTPSVSIGLIYLIIISFFTFSFFLPIHSQFLMPKGHPPLHFYQLIIWRLLTTTVVYFFLSLSYSLVSLAFQVPFSNTFQYDDVHVANIPDAFGKGTFVVFWMLNFVGMYALGLASENVTMVIGQPWTSLWLIFWVISNVSTSFYNIDTAPTFYRYGYAWPLHNIVEASRTILFARHSKLGLNFGILFAWCAINTVVFIPATMFMRYKANKDEMRERAGHNKKKKIKYLIDG